MSNGTITKHDGATAVFASYADAPLMDLLRAMGHTVNSSAPTEEFVTMPGRSNTLNAANFSGVDTDAKITAMIAYGVANNYPYGFIPKSMRNYNAAAVTFNTALRLLTEGGREGREIGRASCRERV